MSQFQNNLSFETLINAVESSGNGIVIADCLQPDMPLIYVNPGFIKMTGYQLEEITGKNCRFLQGPETNQADVDKLRQAIKSKEKCRVVLLNYKKNGEKFWNDLSMAPVFDANGQLTNFIGVQDDITMQKEAHDAMVESKLKAEDNDRMKTDFLNTMSHELRTPLTVMLGNLPLLTDPTDIPPADEVAEIALHIEESGKHLLRLINELLDISRIEGGKMLIYPEEVSAVDLVDDVLSLVAAPGLKKGLQIVKNVEDFHFFADPLRMKQVLINQAGNAIKFTDEGSVTIKAYKQNDKACFEEVDTGIGMKENDLPFIFDVFRQVDSSSTKMAGGSGLGLAITKKLVELQRGTISVKSHYNEGSQFTVIIPA